MKTFEQAFPGGPLPAVVAVQAEDVTSAEVAAGIEALKQRALATGQMREPVQMAVSPDSSVAQVLLPLVGDSADERSRRPRRRCAKRSCRPPSGGSTARKST